MFRTFAILAVPICLALLVGPLGYAISNRAKLDPSNVYLIVGSEFRLNDALSQNRVTEVSPYRPRFARMVQMQPTIHASLVEHLYWIFPASALAALCGVELKK